MINNKAYSGVIQSRVNPGFPTQLFPCQEYVTSPDPFRKKCAGNVFTCLTSRDNCRCYGEMHQTGNEVENGMWVVGCESVPYKNKRFQQE